ncbi:MAG: LTA synthase family protein [Bacteroidota bacterium]|nr:sulfatase-like hydrolase/transferase [Sphingobacteriales bacterium]
MQVPFFKLLFKRLLLAYGIYAACRIAFIAFNYYAFTNQGLGVLIQTFFYGLLFDTSAIIYTHAVFIFLHIIPIPLRHHPVYGKILKIYFISVNSIAVLLNLIDTGYYPFSGKRSGLELLNMKQDIADQAITYLIDYWYLTGLLIIFIWLLSKLYNQTGTEPPKMKNPTKQILKESLLILPIAALTFLGARGGWNLKPLGVFDAARLVKPEMVSATINTPFQMIMTVQQTGIKEVFWMPETEALNYFNPEKKKTNGTNVRKNIVLIIAESLGKEYVGHYNNGKGYTPFIDSLIGVSISFEHAYANGKRSITGLPAIMASMPSWMEDAYTSSYYQSNRLLSIGGYLQQAGYHASFYHGARNGSMSFDNFIGITKGGHYYGLNEYPDEKDFDGHWGIYDGPYLQYFCKEIGTHPKPFFATLFTLSSHHPYAIPPTLKNKYKDGTLPIHKSVAYTDDAIRDFFRCAASQPWFKETIFIVTADHSAENEQPAYQSMEGMYRIPFIIFDPAQPKRKQINKTVQQLDLLPTILELSGYNGKYFGFGESAIDSLGGGFAIQYYNNIYQLIQYPYVLLMTNGEPFFLGNVEEDITMQTNLLASEKEIALKLEKQLKAVIQTYNSRLTKNKTYISDNN